MKDINMKNGNSVITVKAVDIEKMQAKGWEVVDNTAKPKETKREYKRKIEDKHDGDL